MKNAATKLAAYLKSQGIAVTRSQALEAVSRMDGHRDWNTASAAHNKAAERLLADNLQAIECHIRLAHDDRGKPAIFIATSIGDPPIKGEEAVAEFKISPPPKTYVEALAKAVSQTDE